MTSFEYSWIKLKNLSSKMKIINIFNLIKLLKRNAKVDLILIMVDLK